MNPEDFTSFDQLITPQYVTVLFWVGIAASVLLGLGMIFTGGAGVPFGLAVLIGGPILTRASCELLILAFKTVDWIAEINATLTKQKELLAEQAQRGSAPPSDEQPSDEQGSARLDEDTASREFSSTGSAGESPSSHGEPTLPSSQ
jgi:hypothetical protein